MAYFVIIGILLQAAFIMVEHKEKYLSAVILKGLASLTFVLLGFRCSTGSDFSKWILLGLILGMGGDILLNLRFLAGKNGQKVFLVGILVFMMGHVMYLIALLREAPQVWIPVAAGIVMAAALLYWILTSVTAAKAFKIFGVFYIGAVTMMAVAAVWNYLKLGGSGNMLFAIGGLLFLASDVILIFNTFTGQTTFPKRIANLSLYYIGQLLIAGCLLFL